MKTFLLFVYFASPTATRLYIPTAQQVLLERLWYQHTRPEAQLADVNSRFALLDGTAVHYQVGRDVPLPLPPSRCAPLTSGVRCTV